MKCKICGANLKKDGDICVKCYKTYQEEEDLKKDTKVILKFKRKYSIMYEITKNIWIIALFILSMIVCMSSGTLLEVIIVFLAFVSIFGFLLFLDKRIAMATQVVFYEKKVVYTFKFLFIDIEKIVKYTDITDITYYQTLRQKRFGFGDLCIYAKGMIPGATLLNGFQIKNIENVSEILQSAHEIIGLVQK